MKAAYLDNMSYEETGSQAMCRAFITACKALLLSLPAKAGHGQATVELSPPEIRMQLNDARAWLALNPAGGNGGVAHYDFSEFRS